MPRTIPPSKRKDSVLKIRISYSDHKKVSELAKQRKITASELVRQLIEAELNELK